jgi:hypothetical protein
VGSRTGVDDVEKILDLAGTRTPSPSVDQPVASRYTDCAILTPIYIKRRPYSVDYYE